MPKSIQRMQRFNAHLTKSQLTVIKQSARRTGLTIAETLRRIIDSALAAGLQP